jgi:hypothetical protein
VAYGLLRQFETTLQINIPSKSSQNSYGLKRKLLALLTFSVLVSKKKEN